MCCFRTKRPTETANTTKNIEHSPTRQENLAIESVDLLKDHTVEKHSDAGSDKSLEDSKSAEGGELDVNETLKSAPAHNKAENMLPIGGHSAENHTGACSTVSLTSQNSSQTLTPTESHQTIRRRLSSGGLEDSGLFEGEFDVDEAMKLADQAAYHRAENMLPTGGFNSCSQEKYLKTIKSKYS